MPPLELVWIEVIYVPSLKNPAVLYNCLKRETLKVTGVLAFWDYLSRPLKCPPLTYEPTGWFKVRGYFDTLLFSGQGWPILISFDMLIAECLRFFLMYNTWCLMNLAPPKIMAENEVNISHISQKLTIFNPGWPKARQIARPPVDRSGQNFM